MVAMGRCVNIGGSDLISVAYFVEEFHDGLILFASTYIIGGTLPVVVRTLHTYSGSDCSHLGSGSGGARPPNPYHPSRQSGEVPSPARDLRDLIKVSPKTPPGEARH